MVYALPLGLALVIMLPIMGYLMLNDLGKYLKKWLDSKPNGRKDYEVYNSLYDNHAGIDIY